jgi:hypothetical protein
MSISGNKTTHQLQVITLVILRIISIPKIIIGT